MEHQLPKLPYPLEALEPYISAETFKYHYGKHHKAYVTKLNELIKDTKFEKLELEEIIKMSEGALFNNAAQHWNHTFFWSCLKPDAGGNPNGKVSGLIDQSWGNFEDFKDEFSKLAMANFGSGWTWVVVKQDGTLQIMNTSNADTPLKHGMRAILTLDVWEHAYYIDYRNERTNFVQAFWNVVNWSFVNQNLSSIGEQRRERGDFSGNLDGHA